MVCKLLSHGGEILIPDRLLDRFSHRQATAIPPSRGTEFERSAFPLLPGPEGL